MVECISHEVLHLGFIYAEVLKDIYSEVFWTRKRSNCANILMFFIKQRNVTVGIMMYKRTMKNKSLLKVNLFLYQQPSRILPDSNIDCIDGDGEMSTV